MVSEKKENLPKKIKYGSMKVTYKYTGEIIMKLDLESIGRKIASFFGQSVEDIARQTKFVQQETITLQIVNTFTAINLLDSTVLALPTTMSKQYPGCGLS
ncbi:MAG: hypothetical protein B6242_16340 [Anaerolineaceae bacterium 4572_78]|nr:MAG: hypothetical protein B6242_16340 [Anaerolineaceae bacterium 4572_78]